PPLQPAESTDPLALFREKRGVPGEVPRIEQPSVLVNQLEDGLYVLLPLHPLLERELPGAACAARDHKGCGNHSAHSHGIAPVFPRKPRMPRSLMPPRGTRHEPSANVCPSVMTG